MRNRHCYMHNRHLFTPFGTLSRDIMSAVLTHPAPKNRDTPRSAVPDPNTQKTDVYSLEQMAKQAGTRKLSVTQRGAKTDTLVEGQFTLKREFDGVLVHACMMEEQQTAEVSCEQSAELTFGVMLEGEITFGHNGEMRTINTSHGARGWATNLIRPAQWKRQLKAKQRVHKLVVSVTSDWLKHNLLHVNTPPFFSHLVNTHLARTEWHASSSLIRLAKKVMRSRSDTPSQALQFHANVLAFIAQVLDDLEGSKQSMTLATESSRANQNLNQQALKVKQHLEEQIRLLQPGQQLKLANISEQLGMSISKLQRVAKNHFGCTIAEYLRIRRLEIARYEIQHNNLSIGEAAYMAGYNHRSNFSKAFKQHFDLCPGDLVSK